MKNSKNVVYKKFFSESVFSDEFCLMNVVDNTLWKGKVSKNSFEFKGGKDKRKKYKNKYEILNDVFNINIPEDKYNEAISGDGSEENRITTVHSSSLAALLFFHNIENEKLTLELEKDVYYIFDEVHFERKTKVYPGCKEDEDSLPHYSNMDVVLISEDKKTVLFLECKFSEYLKSGKYKKISTKVYSDIYKKLNLSNLSNENVISNMVANIDDNNEYFELLPKANYQYCGGIKQMISHYMGIKNFIEEGNFVFKNDEKKEKKYFNKLDVKPEKILLGEILFKFSDEVDKHRFKNYETAYKELAVAINAYSKNNINKEKEIFRMLPEILTYDQIFDGYELPQRIKELYQLK